MFDISAQLYNAYVLQSYDDGYYDNCAEVTSAREDLMADMLASPDYQANAKRNGFTQGMIFTRGGEQHTYNIVCRPGDVIYAGDVIEVFGSHWLVMEARADNTTHMTGTIMQCNHLFRFQNFNDPRIIERWGIVDMSGYSSSFNSDTQLQRGEEQMLFYMPYDCDTAKIFVDKRLASHVGYDKNGEPILFTFKVTGVNPVAESFNPRDHLLVIKAVRDLYSPTSDSLELEICDYVECDRTSDKVDESLLPCSINGRNEMRIGTIRVYTATFYDADGNEVDDVTPIWTIDAQDVDIKGSQTEKGWSIDVPHKTELIGTSFDIVVTAADGTYRTVSKTVEVVGIG